MQESLFCITMYVCVTDDARQYTQTCLDARVREHVVCHLSMNVRVCAVCVCV